MFNALALVLNAINTALKNSVNKGGGLCFIRKQKAAQHHGGRQGIALWRGKEGDMG
jgi:hypothetical protein